jgi:endo-1,4-beta-xylanase
MSIKAYSRLDFTVSVATTAALGVFGTAALSGMSAFATSQAGSFTGANGVIPHGSANGTL